jgi:hypothetical protein
MPRDAQAVGLSALIRLYIVELGEVGRLMVKILAICPEARS